ncbi:dTDP-glucose 4,6-dehydratase [Mycolicibacter terrae]|uniref:dTDP-glucose 4,6-dehydratase n=1 Tax=Mycolicibacter terrae TaxID=1788 RepID=A0AAD1I622_9MYCO|nr:NAD(P)-dependent oxidoreductase [Mycolicibacter terrae]ORW93585.1 epimerase [Mycolicibacter terrae]BBX24301.1 dTDP-glucose 4,6-dehydratase [Mycolicibacter terrae]SNV54507.1 NAD dependent epimerase/dehydratase family protein [Mycolicibacter terrae]
MSAAEGGRRIFFAGASGVIGSRLVPMLVQAGHTVGAMTRSAAKADGLAFLGAQPIVCDVFDRPGLTSAVRAFSPDLVLHQLTDLPDDLDDLPEVSLLNARIRVEGTRNLLGALEGLPPTRIVAQSVAWTMRPGPEADAVVALEEAVLAANGVVLRYGLFYGPGTYYQGELPPAPRVHIDIAAARTLQALEAPSGILTVVSS